MYIDPNFKTKKELKQAVMEGQTVTVYSPGPFPPRDNGVETVEGPHYPAPYTWYARVVVDHGRVIKVVG